MQSESLSRPLFAGQAWSRTRAAMTWSTLWSAVIVFLLVVIISRSTVAAAWVSYGIETAPVLALAGAALMAVLALSPLPSYVCVPVGLVLGPIAAAVDAAPAFRAYHADDPAGLALIQTWIGRIQDGSAFGDNAFVLFVIAWLMWATGAWLAWCVLRWRQPLIGLIPGAAAFATNVLNWPDNQNGFTLGFLVLTFALLLWTNYTGSIARAVASHVKLSGDAKWDFWESGLVATAALIVLGILLPPISTTDRTATMESSLFSSWAQLQQQLNHQDSSALTGSGTSTGTTGFSNDIRLGAELKKSTAVVFTYNVAGAYIGPRYFRGVNATEMIDGEWRYTPAPEFKMQVPHGTVPEYGELYNNPTYATFSVNMQVPPPGNTDVLFYPGQLDKIDRDTIATESINPAPIGSQLVQPLYTIDRLSSLKPSTSKGTYNVTVAYPNAFPTDLENAGTAYPDWLQPYMTPPPTSYRPQAVLDMERTMAESIVAGKSNVFDMAFAIRNYLYDNYHYSLNPGPVPQGRDGMDWFLNQTKKGYCVYFATAMGDMLRLLGIPTRLASGFAAGTLSSDHSKYLVTGSDAHVWVEVYFPGFGWIPFDPTPAPNITPLQQYGQQNGQICVSADRCATPGTTTGGVVPTPGNREITRGNNQQVGGGTPGGTGPFRFGLPDAGTLTRILAVLLAVMLMVAAFVSRYLRPRTVMGVWQRTLVLARLAGAALTPGETPNEFGRRLGRLFPEAEGPVGSLTTAFAVAAYAPPDAASASKSGVMDAWTQLRPMMLRRAVTRLRPHRA